MVTAVEKKHKVIWFCEQCQVVGSVRTEDKAGVMEVMYQLEDDHVAVSPDCRNSVKCLRVINPEMDWKSSVPEWAREKIDEQLMNE